MRGWWLNKDSATDAKYILPVIRGRSPSNERFGGRFHGWSVLWDLGVSWGWITVSDEFGGCCRASRGGDVGQGREGRVQMGFGKREEAVQCEVRVAHPRRALTGRMTGKWSSRLRGVLFSVLGWAAAVWDRGGSCADRYLDSEIRRPRRSTQEARTVLARR